MKFSSWVKFDNRDSFGDLSRYPGVYALAISDENIEGVKFDYIEEIKYFGMTNSKLGLKGRLNAFNNTLKDKSGPGHGGAERFRFDYKDGENLASKLYVAVCPFKCNVESIARKDLLTMGDVVRGEYLAWANYAEIHNKLPKYNDKKNSPKMKL